MTYMKKNWTESEILYLKENWDIKLVRDIMEDLNRTEDSIMRKARRLGLNIHRKEEELMKIKWTKEEDKFIIEHYKKKSANEISLYINRTASSIRKRARVLKMSSAVSHWTHEEELFLYEKWGIVSADRIAKQLGRSRNAVLLKAYQMSLREQITANGTYFTPIAISGILHINIRTLYSWICNGFIRYHRFRVGKRTKYQITADAFCEFIKNHQDKWNSEEADIALIRSYCCSYFICEDGNLEFKEESTKWLEEKMARDKLKYRKLMKPWTTCEEKELLHLLKSGYSHSEVCSKLDRSMGSTKTKIYALKNRTTDQISSVS